MNHAIPARTRTDLEGNPMKIGELAILTHTPVETIRYYEREGLLPEAARTGGNYRIYDQAQAARLSLIRHCRGLDMTLDEIRTLLRFNLTFMVQLPPPPIMKETMGRQAAGPGRDMFWWL
jgi:hypothetical protein